MNTSDVTALIAQADKFAREKEWGKAFQTLQEACMLAPSDPTVHARLGVFLLQFGYPVEHWLPVFERAARLSSMSAEIQTELGLAYAVAGKLPQAAETLKRALLMKGCPALAANLLALLHVQEMRHTDAVRTLQRAILQFPGNLHGLELLARLYELEGDAPSARFLLQEILKTDPAHRGASLALRRIALRELCPHPLPRPMGGVPPKSVVMLVEDRRIDRRVLDEARSLTGAGWEVTVVAGEPPEENPYWDEECFPDVRIVRVNERMLSVPCFGESFAYTVPFHRRKASSVLRRDHLTRVLPDQSWQAFLHERRGFYIIAVDIPAAVYVAHDLPQLPAAAMAALQYGAHLVYDSHELFPEQSFVRKNKPLLEAMERHLAPLADRVIVVNESMVEEMKARYGVDAEVILNCPSFELSELPIPRTRMLRESLEIPGEKKILLYQGNIVAGIRNLENVIAAMALIDRTDVALVLMGPDNGGGSDLVALAGERGVLGRSVFFHPSVKQSELLSYTASADVGLIPYTPVDWNTKYCTPNKLYEFIVAELPILANRLPELTRFVAGQGIGINLPMGEPHEIAAAVDAMFASDIGNFRTRLREISPRFVWQNHEGPKIVGIYEVLGREAPRLRMGNAVPAAVATVEAR